MSDLIGFCQPEIDFTAQYVIQREKFCGDFVCHRHKVFGTFAEQDAFFRQLNVETVTDKQFLSQFIFQ